MLSGFCPASFGVLFCSVVLGCRYTPSTTGPRSQWCTFFTGDVFECDIANRRYVLVLCMDCVIYKIRYNPMYHLYGALPVPYVPVRGTRGVLAAHRYTSAPARCRTSQYPIDFYALFRVSVERSF